MSPRGTTRVRRYVRPEVVEPTVDFLAALAGDGRRSNSASARAGSRSPLAQRGVRVHGIDLLTLRERWSGWQREAFTAESTKHVSVREKPRT